MRPQTVPSERLPVLPRALLARRNISYRSPTRERKKHDTARIDQIVNPEFGHVPLRIRTATPDVQPLRGRLK